MCWWCPFCAARYTVERPPESADTPAWQAALTNAQAQQQQQLVRTENCELMREYGPSYWQQHMGSLENIRGATAHKRDTLKQEVEAVNMQRKTEQLLAGERLVHLEHKWKQVRDTHQSPTAPPNCCREPCCSAGMVCWRCSRAFFFSFSFLNGSLPWWVAS
eukprot:COSAG01_NODE_872_length_12988_cov_4.918846_11_plen_161_part_00